MKSKFGKLAGDLASGGTAMAEVCDLVDGKAVPSGELIEVRDPMIGDGQYIPSGAFAMVRMVKGEWFIEVCNMCPCS